MSLAPNQVMELAEHLRGTTSSLSEAMAAMFDLSEDDLSQQNHMALDSEVFLCEQCGWWCELSEMAENDDWICEECNETV